MIISASLATSTANEHNVGGTSIFSNVPDMLSFPPIEGSPKPICASYAPRSAANGWLQREGSSVILLKYSWNVNLILLKSPPEATILATESTTAYIAP